MWATLDIDPTSKQGVDFKGFFETEEAERAERRSHPPSPLCSDLVISGTADTRFLGETAQDHAGASVSGVGDINAGGYSDFLIGAPGAGPLEEGVAYLSLGGGG